MGSYDGAEVCELVGLYILHNLGKKYDKKNIGLYRGDGLAVFKKVSGPQAERTKKGFQKFFKELGLKIEIKANLTVVDFLDVTFDLTTEIYCPFRKPNDEPTYINTKSNHPPVIIKHLPSNVSRIISDLSCNKEVFDKTKSYYEERLKFSGRTEKLSCSKPNCNKDRRRKKNRKKIIWFNAPCSKNVKTDVGKLFLRLVEKYFPKNHKFHNIFYKNTIKVNYSCMDNMWSIIKRHNKKAIGNWSENKEYGCNCKDKDNCPLENKCLTTSLVHKAWVTNDQNTEAKNYIGLTEGAFKHRFNRHQLSNYASSTELSKHLWKLKNKEKQ